MLGTNDHFSDNGKGNHNVEEINSTPKRDKWLTVVLNDGPFRLDGTQHAMRKSQDSFGLLKGIYDMARYKPSDLLVTNLPGKKRKS